MSNTIKPENAVTTQHHRTETSLNPQCLDDACPQSDDNLDMFIGVNDSISIIYSAAFTALLIAAIIKVFGA